MKAKETYYRIYKNLSLNLFKADLALCLECRSKDDDSFEDTSMKPYSCANEKEKS